MKIFAIVMGGIILVWNCGAKAQGFWPFQTEELHIFHKQGSTYAQRVRATNQCEFEALKAIPRAMAVEVNPGYSNPGVLQCGTYTGCSMSGAINIPATADSYDANGKVRNRYFVLCMEKKGYTHLTVPPCRTDADIARVREAERSNKKQGPVSEATCSILKRRLFE
jgi:hypothetical protein